MCFSGIEKLLSYKSNPPAAICIQDKHVDICFQCLCKPNVTFIFLENIYFICNFEDTGKARRSFLPGIAGQAGTEQCVSNGNGDKMLMEQTVYPAIWHDVVSIAYGTTWAKTQNGKTLC